MKLKPILLTAACAALSSLQATPTLDLDFHQAGENITLNWNILGAYYPNSGAAILIEADNYFSTYGFLGWWNATSGTISGTVSGGWNEPPRLEPYKGLDYFVSYWPDRYDKIFTPGTHFFGLTFFPLPELPPTIFNPDGWITPYFPDSGETVPTVSLLGSFTVAPVPDGGSAWLLLSLASLGLFLFKRP
jgi:hypothetical protein